MVKLSGDGAPSVLADRPKRAVEFANVSSARHRTPIVREFACLNLKPVMTFVGLVCMQKKKKKNT